MNMGMIFSIIMASTLRMSVPVVLAGIGASFSVRGGVTPFGCEGMMIMGAFVGVLGTWLTNNVWIGVLFAIAGAMAIGFLHAFMHVTHRVNATLSGVSINLLGLGLTELLLRVIWRSTSYSPDINGFKTYSPDWLKNIPFVGPILSQQYLFFYITIVLVILSTIVLYKTTFGMRLRMVGENPVAANSVGIDTVKYKYVAVLISGVFSGLSGAYLSMSMLNFFQKGMSAGRGYIALVISSLGRDTPLGAAFAGLFFGFFDSFQQIFQSVKLPGELLMTLPYVFTLVAAVVKINSRTGPAGVGKYHDDM